MKKNILGPRIREIRQTQRPPVTQDDLAARLATKGLKLDRSAISRIEKGERYLTDIELFAIAGAMKVDISELFTGKDKLRT